MNSRLIEVGIVGRPHGFRGQFMLSNSWGEPLPEDLALVYIGETPDRATEYQVEELTEMPKGLRIKLAEFDSDQKVKRHSGYHVYVQQESLPALEKNEFYVGELVGSEVRNEDTGESIGTLSGIEEVGKHHADRWWVDGEGAQYIFPAVADIVARVDASERVVWVRNAESFRQGA